MYKNESDSALLEIINIASETLERDVWINMLTEHLQCLDSQEFNKVFYDLDKGVTKDVVESNKLADEDSIDYLTNEIIQWASDRKIIPNSTPTVQCMKAVSELGELADNIIKGEDVRDSIGDVYVCLCGVAELSNVKMLDCIETAYDDIRDRTGVLLKNGNFLKSTDPQYIAMKERGEL